MVNKKDRQLPYKLGILTSSLQPHLIKFTGSMQFDVKLKSKIDLLSTTCNCHSEVLLMLVLEDNGRCING